MSEIVQELDDQLKIIMHWLNRFLTRVKQNTRAAGGRRDLLHSSLQSARYWAGIRCIIRNETQLSTQRLEEIPRC